MLKMFGVSDVAEAVATRKDRFVNRYALNGSVVCEICIMCSYVFFLFYDYIYHVLPISVNKGMCEMMLLLLMMMMVWCTEELSSMGMRLRLYGCERMRRERMIGECIVSFSSLPAALDYPLEQWLTLEPRSNLSVSHYLCVSLINMFLTSFSLLHRPEHCLRYFLLDTLNNCSMELRHTCYSFPFTVQSCKHNLYKKLISRYLVKYV